MRRRSRIDVFDYLDYRAFLRDFYLTSKKEHKGFSYRAFAQKVGVRAPNYVKLIIDGQRNLTSRLAPRFADACGLEGEQAAYFLDLIIFNQARTARERNLALEKLHRFRNYRKAHRLDLAHAAYHAHWYVPAIRELTLRNDFRDDPSWVAKQMRPRIRRNEAATALEILQDLGMLVRGHDGRLRQAERLVSTGPEMHALHIANYHRAMLKQAADSIETFPSSQRDISSLTLALSTGGVERFKRRIQRFRQELLELAALEEDVAQVVQVNFQLFPLTSEKGDADE